MSVQSPPHKACPVVLRQDGDGRRSILAFAHPKAGQQLIKGTIEQGESPDHAALRELDEESGISEAVLVRSLGRFEVGPPQQVWLAFLCEASGLVDYWTFRTQDGGGHDFQFFWHPLDEDPDERWHLILRQALHELRNRLDSTHSGL